MGEIGIPRREFFFDIPFWEARRIIRGYRRRNRLTNQLIAETAFAAMHAMRGSDGKTVADMFPGLFDDPDVPPPPPISPQEVADLQAEMAAYKF